MAYNLITDAPLSTPVGTDGLNAWVDNYKNQFINQSHDLSQLSLVLPDDSLVVMGPARLSGVSGDDNFYPVGFLNSMQYSETRQVQPLKSIGSRRHIFAATNGPVQGNIGRLLFLGTNLYRAMYALAEHPARITDRNSTYAIGSGESASWYTNAEEDLFRIPVGIGIIYNSPASMAGKKSAGAEYLEVCVLTNRNVSLQSGQAMIMEQVSFMADRVVPWTAYKSAAFASDNTVRDVL